MMRNATRDLLRVSLTVAAVAAALLCAELSTQSAVAVRSRATAEAEFIVHARSISTERRGADQNLGEPAPDVTLTKPSHKQRTQLALAQ